ncbi:MAG: BrnT family toxin [Thermodesulfobacteriota bacterium]
MDFEWDEQKNRSNISKHGFDFADAWEVFEGPMLIDLDNRFDYAEDRWTGIGLLRSRVVVVVYTDPDELTTRIISLRKALTHERKAYAQAFGN